MNGQPSSTVFLVCALLVHALPVAGIDWIVGYTARLALLEKSWWPLP
ncbi:MAG: hypothetical protein ACYCYP_09560 [Leptospirales bacterium]